MVEALEANTWVRTGGSKEDPIWEPKPDHRTRAWAGKVIYELVAGKAVERVEHTLTDGRDAEKLIAPSDLYRILQGRPDLAGAILSGLLDNAKQAEAIGVVDVTPKSDQGQLSGNQ
jgi:hypothetical protein